MDRIGRIGHQHHVARRRDRLRHVGEAFLGAERHDRFGFLLVDERVLRFDSGTAGPVRDSYAYNVQRVRGEQSFHVGDLRMRFVLEWKDGPGQVRLVLSKGKDRFIATLNESR